MTFLQSPSAVALPSFSLRAAFSGIKQGIVARAGHAIAKFANYAAANPTATTTIGSRIGTNPQDPYASIQRVGMQFTAEAIEKNCPLGKTYIAQRQNYCSSQMKYIPATGDPKLDAMVRDYMHGEDGFGGVLGNMGVDCSMQDAFMRTADLEMPVRGDAGMIWYDDGTQMRLMEFSADQLGELYYFVPPRSCSISRNYQGEVCEVPGNDCVYFAGRYFRGCDCVAYKIYERSNSWYCNPRIYQASDVLYFRDPASFRGVRGVTFFSAAIQHMEKGETLFQYGMDAALRQSKTAMAVYNNRGQPDETSYTGTQLSTGQTIYTEQVPGGPVVDYYYNGDEAVFTSPTAPGDSVIAGVETSDERVALALRVNYAWLISATKVGGAPSRLEINKAAKEMNRIKDTIHRPQLRRISYISIMDGVRRGYLPAAPNITKGRWMLPISPSVDAGYDNDATVANLRSGLECPQDIIAETNRDFEEVLQNLRQAAVAIAMAVEDGNDELVANGYKPTITIADIAQRSDNPAQAAQGEQIDRGNIAQKVPGAENQKAA